jgi:hypothetical protein
MAEYGGPNAARRQRDAGDPQLPMRRWASCGRMGHMQLDGGVNPAEHAA